MAETPSQRRLAENEVVFRQTNQQIPKNLAAVKELAEEDNQQSIVKNIDDIPVSFYCECSDEKCRERIVLKPAEYTALHQNSSQFIVIPGHEVPTIERVVNKSNDYLVVEKYETPPETATELNPTK